MAKSGKAKKTNELTSINVEEVSTVDRAANGKKFLLVKGLERIEGEEVDASEMERVEKETQDKDAKDAAEYAALKAKAVADESAAELARTAAIAAAAPVAVAPVATAPVVAPVIASAPTAEVKAKQDLASLVQSAKSESIIVDGTATVTVSADPPEPVAPAATIEQVKTAVLAGIDSIAARLEKFRADVEKDPSSYSASGAPCLYDHVWYLQDMLYALFNIGGAAWEIGAAVNKGHRAITAGRVAKMKGIHKGLGYVMKDLGSLVGELTEDEDAEEALAMAVPVAAAAAKAAPVVVVAPVVTAPTTAVAPAVAPAVSTEVVKQLSELAAIVGNLRGVVADQAVQLSKQRQTVGPSNTPANERSITKSPEEDDTVSWPADMAPPLKARR